MSKVEVIDLSKSKAIKETNDEEVIKDCNCSSFFAGLFGIIIAISPYALIIAFIVLLVHKDVVNAIILYQVIIWMCLGFCLFSMCGEDPRACCAFTIFMFVPFVIFSYQYAIPKMRHMYDKHYHENIDCYTSIMNMTIENTNTTIINYCLPICFKIQNTVEIIKMCKHINEIIV